MQFPGRLKDYLPINQPGYDKSKLKYHVNDSTTRAKEERIKAIMRYINIHTSSAETRANMSKDRDFILTEWIATYVRNNIRCPEIPDVEHEFNRNQRLFVLLCNVIYCMNRKAVDLEMDAFTLCRFMGEKLSVMATPWWPEPGKFPERLQFITLISSFISLRYNDKAPIDKEPYHKPIELSPIIAATNGTDGRLGYMWSACGGVSLIELCDGVYATIELETQLLKKFRCCHPMKPLPMAYARGKFKRMILDKYEHISIPTEVMEMSNDYICERYLPLGARIFNERASHNISRRDTNAIILATEYGSNAVKKIRYFETQKQALDLAKAADSDNDWVLHIFGMAVFHHLFLQETANVRFLDLFYIESSELFNNSFQFLIEKVDGHCRRPIYTRVCNQWRVLFKCQWYPASDQFEAFVRCLQLIADECDNCLDTRISMRKWTVFYLDENSHMREADEDEDNDPIALMVSDLEQLAIQRPCTPPPLAGVVEEDEPMFDE